MAEQNKKVEETKAEEIKEQQAPVDQAAPEGAPQQEAPVKEAWYTKAWNGVKVGAQKVGHGIKKAAPYVAGAAAIFGVAYMKGSLDTIQAQNQDSTGLPDKEKEPEEVEEINVVELPPEESQEEAQETETESEEE